MTDTTKLIAKLTEALDMEVTPEGRSLYRHAITTITAAQGEVARLTTLSKGQHVELYNARLRLAALESQKSVASIFISATGEREMDDWKCDLPQGRNELYAAAGASPVEPSQARELSKEELTDLIAAGLGCTYHCTRVWSAWSVGTMSQDDFEPVDESNTPSI
jgi:hypothetical protein